MAPPNSGNVRFMDDSIDQWCVQEILVQDAALLHYRLRTWPHRDDVHDLRRDVYLRIHESAGKSRPQSARR